MQQYEANKHKRKITLVVSYIAMTLAVIAISLVCILLALGYRFDFSSRTVEQGALLQLGTSPDGAQITLDGKILTFKTNGKQEVAVGQHDVTYQRDGYRNWVKHFSVKAGEVHWLNYARLIPTTVSTEVVVQLGAIADEKPAPDRNSFAVIEKSDTATVKVIDVSNPAKPAILSVPIPTDKLTLTGTGHSYHLTEWSLGSKFVLVRHDFSGGQEFIRVNVTDANDIVNLSSKFGVALIDLHFSTETVFFGIENGNLRKFDMSASSLSEPLVKNVVSMQLYGAQQIAYVRHADQKYEAGVIIGNQPVTVEYYDDTTPILIDVSRYYNEYYLAIARGGSLELIKNPERTANDGMTKVATLSYPSDLKWLDISSNGRFVIAGNGAQFMTYDIELLERSDVNFPTLSGNAAIKPQWLDDFTLVSTGDNKLRLSDFDGDNQQIITDALPSHQVMLGSGGKVLYSFSKNSAGAVVLQVSKLTTDK